MKPDSTGAGSFDTRTTVVTMADFGCIGAGAEWIGLRWIWRRHPARGCRAVRDGRSHHPGQRGVSPAVLPRTW